MRAPAWAGTPALRMRTTPSDSNNVAGISFQTVSPAAEIIPSYTDSPSRPPPIGSVTLCAQLPTAMLPPGGSGNSNAEATRCISDTDRLFLANSGTSVNVRDPSGAIIPANGFPARSSVRSVVVPPKSPPVSRTIDSIVTVNGVPSSVISPNASVMVASLV